MTSAAIAGEMYVTHNVILVNTLYILLMLHTNFVVASSCSRVCHQNQVSSAESTFVTPAEEDVGHDVAYVTK